MRGEHLSTLHHSDLETYFENTGLKETNFVKLSAFDDLATFFAVMRYRKALQAEVPLSKVNIKRVCVTFFGLLNFGARFLENEKKDKINLERILLGATQ